jgi:hypothetical protein
MASIKSDSCFGLQWTQRLKVGFVADVRIFSRTVLSCRDRDKEVCWQSGVRGVLSAHIY